jgi:hypothetical protein
MDHVRKVAGRVADTRGLGADDYMGILCCLRSAIRLPRLTRRGWIDEFNLRIATTNRRDGTTMGARSLGLGVSPY